ncbi:conserved hypothetical protein [Roseovarius sp. EC-HK134]|uniref:hypothetical protein n=1 Tax=unclassified Roseovarius TaxID=2614913 RepID=UPI0012553FCB|nr:MULTISPECIES: hypothetical protein [unclassified Roseovarius]VVT19881.1 conserved hypothetical protein [Roseovarius sp. EC-SD190]VVT20029.1 conserved hypothetical protein [Roseovarius sp. EC-HK134]
MTRRYYYRPWKDESLVSALHFMRCRAVRDDDLELEHVDALLRQLGVDPDTLPMPKKVDKRFKRGELRRAIYTALRDSPLTGPEITEKVRGDMAYADVYRRVYGALDQMKAAGLVRREGRLWIANKN